MAPDQPNAAPGVTASPAARPVPAQGQHRWLAYARLAKIEFWDFYLSLVVVWSLLAPEQWISGVTLAMLAVFFVSQVGVFSAVCAFDDITGYLDGSDIINYDSDESGLRKRHRKPLLDGVLTVKQATRFGWLAWSIGGAAWLAGVGFGPHRPGWTLPLAITVLVLCVQYSWGLKLSYRGLGETLIVFTPVCIVLVPYGVLTGELGGLVLTQALLFGLWQILVSCYSNSNDIKGDSAVRRQNAATTFGSRGNRVFVTGLTAVEPLLLVAVALLGLVPWWFPAVLAAVLLLRGRQLGGFLRSGDALLARRRGIAIHRVGVASLVAFNLAYGLL